MFDTTIVNRTQYVPANVHVTEKRAPTDDSVALLKEMELAAKEKIVASIAVEYNSIKCHWVVFEDHLTDKLFSRLIININGERIEVEDNVSRHDLIGHDAAQKYISERLSGVIARNIMQSCMKNDAKLLSTINRLFRY